MSGILGTQPTPTAPQGMLSGGPKLALRPLGGTESVPNPDGSISTERTVTIPTQEGWVNVPSLWMGPNGPVNVPEERIGQLLKMYEAENGPSFQRFGSVEEAVQSAKARSDAGGAKSGMLR